MAPRPQNYAKAELIRRGIPQKAIAEQLGTSQKFVSAVFCGRKAAPERFRRLVAELTGLSAEELFR